VSEAARAARVSWGRSMEGWGVERPRGLREERSCVATGRSSYVATKKDQRKGQQRHTASTIFIYFGIHLHPRLPEHPRSRFCFLCPCALPLSWRLWKAHNLCVPFAQFDTNALARRRPRSDEALGSGAWPRLWLSGSASLWTTPWLSLCLERRRLTYPHPPPHTTNTHRAPRVTSMEMVVDARRRAPPDGSDPTAPLILVSARLVAGPGRSVFTLYPLPRLG
jgi:hypothetical protein